MDIIEDNCTHTSISPMKHKEMLSLSEIVKANLPDLKPYEGLCKVCIRSDESHCSLTYRQMVPHSSRTFLPGKATAEAIVKHLEVFNAYDIHSSVGVHGVAAVLANGPGKTILLRADIDALPVQERIDLPYASTVRMKDSDGVEKPLMHACGHDMNITALLGAAETLFNARGEWSGTLILCFQPARRGRLGHKI
jgi:hypothetical protein